MPHMRLVKQEASDAEGRTDVASSEQELSNEPQATPATPSFKGRLTKYQYTESTKSESSDTTSSSRPTRAAKRALPLASSDIATRSTPSPSPKKRRTPSKYADPSKYAHLSPLVDILEPNLICVFVGTNPGPSISPPPIL